VEALPGGELPGHGKPFEAAGFIAMQSRAGLDVGRRTDMSHQRSVAASGTLVVISTRLACQPRPRSEKSEQIGSSEKSVPWPVVMV
jgi:hypothetical protein